MTCFRPGFLYLVNGSGLFPVLVFYTFGLQFGDGFLDVVLGVDHFLYLFLVVAFVLCEGLFEFVGDID